MAVATQTKRDRLLDRRNLEEHVPPDTQPAAAIVYDTIRDRLGLVLYQDGQTCRRDTSADENEGLSLRELQVLQLVAAGYSNKEIAAKLEISVNTAKVHLQSIFARLKARTRNEAVARAILDGHIGFTSIHPLREHATGARLQRTAATQIGGCTLQGNAIPTTREAQSGERGLGVEICDDTGNSTLDDGLLPVGVITNDVARNRYCLVMTRTWEQRLTRGKTRKEVRLDPTDRRILELLARGAGSKQIGRELSRNSDSAGRRIKRVLNKLGVSSRAEAVAFATQLRWIC